MSISSSLDLKTVIEEIFLLYELSITMEQITSNLSGIKQHTFIILQFLWFITFRVA